MNKYFIFLFFLISVTTKIYSQKSLNEYSYVIVSEQFEFQKEKDKYQLNSLTKFLFNKYGFHAFFDREVPNNVKRCDGLWAEAVGSPGFIYTRVQLILTDCNGVEVFRTKFGNSKIKDYQKAYYESMREAFEDIKLLHVQQKDIIEVEITQESNEKTTLPSTTKTKVNGLTTSKTDAAIIVESSSVLANLPTSKYTNYTYLGKNFLLRKTTLGYTFYQELENKDDDLLLVGKLIIKEKEIEFVSKNATVLKASFDNSKNLLVGEGDSLIVYKIVD